MRRTHMPVFCRVVLLLGGAALLCACLVCGANQANATTVQSSAGPYLTPAVARAIAERYETSLALQEILSPEDPVQLRGRATGSLTESLLNTPCWQYGLKAGQCGLKAGMDIGNNDGPKLLTVFDFFGLNPSDLNRIAPDERFASSGRLHLYAARNPLLWDPLKQVLVSEGLDKTLVNSLFARIKDEYSPEYMGQKVIELHGLRYRGNPVLKLPADMISSFEPPSYQALSGTSIASCRAFMKRNEKLLASIHRIYGVPPAVITGIMVVETGLGNNVGTQSAFRVLASMAATDSLEAVKPSIKGLSLTQNQERDLDLLVFEKAQWARNELTALIRYGAANNIDIVNMPGSIYGAVGLCQFMPSNINVYGVDADGDGKIDLFKLADAAHSIGRYLAYNGWKNADTPAEQLKVLRSYNHSDAYAATVYGVSMQLISPTVYASAQSNVSAIFAARRSIGYSVPTKFKRPPPNARIAPLPGYNSILNVGVRKDQK